MSNVRIALLLAPVILALASGCAAPSTDEEGEQSADALRDKKKKKPSEANSAEPAPTWLTVTAKACDGRAAPIAEGERYLIDSRRAMLVRLTTASSSPLVCRRLEAYMMAISSSDSAGASAGLLVPQGGELRCEASSDGATGTTTPERPSSSESLSYRIGRSDGGDVSLSIGGSSECTEGESLSLTLASTSE